MYLINLQLLQRGKYEPIPEPEPEPVVPEPEPEPPREPTPPPPPSQEPEEDRSTSRTSKKGKTINLLINLQWRSILQDLILFKTTV